MINKWVECYFKSDTRSHHVVKRNYQNLVVKISSSSKKFTEDLISQPIIKLKRDTTKLPFYLYSFSLLWKNNIIKINNADHNLLWL